MFFSSLAGCVHELKRYQQIIKHDTQIYPNGIQNSFKNQAASFNQNSREINPWCAQWAKRRPRVIGGRCDLPPTGPYKLKEKSFHWGEERWYHTPRGLKPPATLYTMCLYLRPCVFICAYLIGVSLRYIFYIFFVFFFLTQYQHRFVNTLFCRKNARWTRSGFIWIAKWLQPTL